MADDQLIGRATVPAGVTAPYVPQDLEEVAALVRNLEKAAKGGKQKHGFSIKKTEFDVSESRDGLTVDSWRLQDWDYKRPDLPTYARGLFTTRNQRGTPEIAVRGYDKFFNVDEVHHTRWENILTRTKGPYELTLKENGCIIFISGLEDGTLLVCSKHSTGDRSDIEVSHASAGEQRLERQLQALGKTKRDLAQELRSRNVTAVAELCDDTFEEHILAYGPEKAGLYLHGLNLNLPYFKTYPGALVQQFARDWGFKETGLIVMDDVNAVKTFLDEVAETGAHDGRDVEGFVIRCKMTTDGNKYDDWFFKYKFEEPYLMYRQWRECTKALIAGKPARYKKHAKITEEYLLYARRRLAKDPSLGKAYNQNHGIIALRNDFLAFKNLKGSDAANFEELGGSTNVRPEVKRDVILVPIATIGCGKTTLALALTHLFGWGHVQNDNITGSKRPPRFTKAVLDQLEELPVVFADRNNAERRERKQILTDVKQQRHTGVCMVALNFVHRDVNEVRHVTQGRVFTRGDNHQTIRAATNASKVQGIMENFLTRFEPCDPEHEPDFGFDSVIDLDPTVGSRANLETVITDLHGQFPNLLPRTPTVVDMDEAIEQALDGYKPGPGVPDRTDGKGKSKRQDGHKQEPPHVLPAKKKPLEYMAIDLPGSEILTEMERLFGDVPHETARFYRQLQQTRRLQPRFHVTLAHRAAARECPALWERYSRLHAVAAEAPGQEGVAGQTAAAPVLGTAEVLLERVVFTPRIMAIVVQICGGEWECANRVAHITIGTRDDSVKPKESNDMLGRWKDLGSGGGITELPIEWQPVISGVVRGVLSR